MRELWDVYTHTAVCVYVFVCVSRLAKAYYKSAHVPMTLSLYLYYNKHTVRTVYSSWVRDISLHSLYIPRRREAICAQTIKYIARSRNPRECELRAYQYCRRRRRRQ